MNTEPFSENALTVLERRYLRKDADGLLIETPEEMLWRVATAVASADASGENDKLASSFHDLMSSRRFFPNSPTLMNAGKQGGQLSACFVLPIKDDMHDIFKALSDTAMIHKSGGGTGFSFSNLRPKGDQVGSTGGISSGPLSFMRIFDTATEMVKQGGSRRGANMGILRVDHPDIEEFIGIKGDTSVLNNFNLSVALTDDFMRAVRENGQYPLVNPRCGEVVKMLDANAVMEMIVKEAHATGEPGIVFIDEMNRKNPTPKAGDYEATNPCGETPLLPYESCNLGSINLSRMLSLDGKALKIDWSGLKRTVETAVLFLDLVIEANVYPLEVIRTATLGNRKIGLGVMGWADLLFWLSIPYGSDESVKLAEEVMSFVRVTAKEASRKLGESKGDFPNFRESTITDVPNQRNATLTTIAPTGSISIIAGCSSGIEPVFSLAYYRNIMDGDRMLEVNPVFEQVSKARGFYSVELMARLAAGESLQAMSEIPDDVRAVFVTARDVTPEGHLRMQAAFQKFTDNAVSKTVNLPANASLDAVKEIFFSAHSLGCKGVTIYRDGSRANQAMQVGPAPELPSSDPDRRIRLTLSEDVLKRGLRWNDRPFAANGHQAWNYHCEPVDGPRLGVSVSHIENGRVHPFEVWLLGAEQPRGLGPVAKSLSMDMRSNDPKWLKAKLESLMKTSGDDAFSAPLPPDGALVHVPSIVAAFAKIIHYRVESIGYFKNIEDAESPIHSCLMSPKEPKTTDSHGTSAYYDVSNPVTSDDFTMFVKEARMPDGSIRPFSVWLSGRYPKTLDGLTKLLSFDMRVSDVAWIGKKLRQLRNFPEHGGDFRARIPGDAEGRSTQYPSTVSYMVNLLIHHYTVRGLLDANGFALGSVKGEGTQPLIRPGKICKECGAAAVIRRDGCDYCTFCNTPGNC